MNKNIKDLFSNTFDYSKKYSLYNLDIGNFFIVAVKTPTSIFKVIDKLPNKKIIIEEIFGETFSINKSSLKYISVYKEL